jgi:hypothetical protein
MYYSYIEIEYVAMRFSPARMDLAVKLLRVRGKEAGNQYLACMGKRIGSTPDCAERETRILY